tara:strand:+ start:1739 stop:2839 length:1101 start_codon:yes stop_codon:yes gene_type:complete
MANFTLDKGLNVARLEQSNRLSNNTTSSTINPSIKINPLQHYFAKLREDAEQGTELAATPVQADLYYHTSTPNPLRYEPLSKLTDVTIWNPGPRIPQDEEMRPVIQHSPTGLLMLLPEGTAGKNYVARVTEIPTGSDTTCNSTEQDCKVHVLKAQLGTCTLDQSVSCGTVSTTDLREQFVAYSDDFEPKVDDLILVHETPYDCAFMTEILCTTGGSDSTFVVLCCSTCDPTPSQWEFSISTVTGIFSPNLCTASEFNRMWELDLSIKQCTRNGVIEQRIIWEQEFSTVKATLGCTNTFNDPIIGSASWTLSFGCKSSGGSAFNPVASYTIGSDQDICDGAEKIFNRTFQSPGTNWPATISVTPEFI